MDHTNNVPPGIIFDLDGTLADTLQDIADALNHALQREGLPVHSSERVRTMIGDGLPVLMGRAAGTEEPERIATLVKHFREHYARHYLRHTRLYDGVDRALNEVQQAGCPMAVLSNKPHDFTQRICHALLEPWPLVGAIGTREGHHKKPHPAEAYALADEMRRCTRNVVIVGDADIDVRTARSAGMRSVAVTWGFGDRPSLEAAGPDRIVNCPEDLPEAILSLCPY